MLRTDSPTYKLLHGEETEAPRKPRQAPEAPGPQADQKGERISFIACVLYSVPSLIDCGLFVVVFFSMHETYLDPFYAFPTV